MTALTYFDATFPQFPTEVQAILQEVRETSRWIGGEGRYQMPAFWQHGILASFAALEETHRFQDLIAPRASACYNS